MPVVELLAIAAALAWLPALLQVLDRGLRTFWEPSRAAVRAAVMLLSPVVFVGWDALAGEIAVGAAMALWFLSGDLRAYLIAHAVLRSHLLGVIASIRSRRSGWRYLQMYLLTALGGMQKAPETVSGTEAMGGQEAAAP